MFTSIPHSTYLNLYFTKEYSPFGERVLVEAAAVFLHGSLATFTLPEIFSVVSDSL
jgi:hypothetical protein